jgi:hypothetical protein
MFAGCQAQANHLEPLFPKDIALADLSDVMSKIADLATTACYPSGTSATSVTTRRIYIMQGWPKPQDMDNAMTSNYVLVNIYAIQGSTSNAPQVFAKPQIIIPAVTGLSASIDDATGTVVTLSGTPQVGEYVTLIVDKHSYSYVYAPGNTAADFATGLVALIRADYANARANGTAITIDESKSIVARIAAPTTLGRTIHRQTQQIRIVVWANNPTDRNTVSAAIDVFLKQNLKISFADTSEAIVNYQGTYLDDNLQNTGEYRRDIIFTVTYATVEQFPGYNVTSVGFSGEFASVTVPNFNV